LLFEKLDNELPNGFHDAQLIKLVLDYATRLAILEMRILTGTPHGADSEEYRTAKLLVTGLCFCIIESPDTVYPFVPDGSGVSISGYPEDSRPAEKPNESLPMIKALLAKCPVGAWSYRFFSRDWNSFIHIAGTNVELSWIENSR